MESTYTSAELATIIAAIGVLVGSIFTGIVTVITALRNNKQTERIKDAIIGDETHQGLIGQVKEVHTLTNSNMTRETTKNALLTVEIQSLKEMVRDLKTERDKKEVAAAATPAPVAAPADPAAVNMEVENMNVESFKAPDKK